MGNQAGGIGKGCAIAAGVGCLGLIGASVLLALISHSALKSAREAEQSRTSSTTSMSSGALNPSSVSVPTHSNWEYESKADEMGRGEIHYASVTSSNTVNFGFPYQGEQHATLMLRTHPKYGKDVILQIQRGQFLAGIDGCTVSVVFDNEKPMRIHANAPSDNSSDAIFINGYSTLISKLRKAKTVRIEAPFYQEGERVFSFQVDGLKWEDGK